MLSGVEVLKVIHQENQTLIQRLSKEARANWMTMGYFAGFLLAMIVPPPSSWWLDALLVFGPVALLQWFSRLGWEKKRGTEAVKSGG
jgi:Na+-translocating ferredoxin:NAD+ oxidoreductase RnfD subunit